MVRGLTFAGHALSSIGFAGAAGAVLVGISPVLGLLVSTLGASLAISVLGREIRERDIAIGVIMTFALGLGVLFLSLYHGYAEQAYSILFGTIVGISRGDVWVTAVLSLGVLAVMALVGRPLLFSSFDGRGTRAAGPVVGQPFPGTGGGERVNCHAGDRGPAGICPVGWATSHSHPVDSPSRFGHSAGHYSGADLHLAGNFPGRE